MAEGREDDSTRRKKLVKKANKGEVFTIDAYLECLRMNIYDIRDLLVCVLFDKQCPKRFQIKNKPFIRTVSVIHISNCDVILPNISGIDMTPSYTVKISNAIHDASSFPLKLLSYSLEEYHSLECLGDDKDVSVFPDMDFYILTEPLMRLWGYPLLHDSDQSSRVDLITPRPLIAKTKIDSLSDLDQAPIEHHHIDHRGDSVINHEDKDVSQANGDCSPSKRRRLDPIEILEAGELTRASMGVMAGSVDSLADTMEMLHKYSDLLASASVGTKEGSGLEHGYLQTLPFEAVKDMFSLSSVGLPNKVVAIDCEMCKTSAGSELTRITVIDQHSRVLLDSFVRPANPIVDYLSEYSGITESHLANVNVTLQQIQLSMLRIITRETIVVGHSLDNDLRACKLYHRNCVDTALLYPHNKGFPYRHKLKYLAEEYLSMKIQRSASGHDSVEDARTCMQLFLLKVEHGPTFGIKKIAASRMNILTSHGCLKRSPGRNIDSHRPRIKSGFFCSSEIEKDLLSSTIPSSSDYAEIMKSICLHEDIDRLLTSHAEFFEEEVYQVKDTGTALKDVSKDESETQTDVGFGYLSFNYVEMKDKDISLQSIINKVVSNAKIPSGDELDHRNHMVILTTQPSSSMYESLFNRKKACFNTKSFTVSTWTKELEMQLKESLSYYHTGRVYFGI